ncbi:15026_t:CDS:2 [Dentiscutata heterogama]|uniref:15026_t:CDS:1 n=1 Tax=Dentiscutata heterogama TaxID=1316150 RepID=A0ACA9K6N3_9GLOM|nr:15026_t:CDS:2 [Dentiscutata heterogama]
MSLDKTNSTKSSKDAVPSSEPYKKRRITDNNINEPTIELVTGFEDNQIQSLNPKERTDQPIIIPAMKNANWLERSQALAAARSKESAKVKTTNVKTLDNSAQSLKQQDLAENKESDKVKTTSVKTSDNSEQYLKQQALAEILKGPKTESDIEQTEQTLVLQVGKNKNLESRKEKALDLEAFRREVEGLPDEADIDYDSVPIEDFGAAMLRGMGWKPGMTIGKNQKIKSIELREPKARPTHLGLGASPLPAKDAHGLR